MSRFGQYGQIGGGGVRRPNEPPRGGGGFGGHPQRRGGYGGDRDRPDQTVADLWPGYLDGGYFDVNGNLKIDYVAPRVPGDQARPDGPAYGVEQLIRAMADAHPALTTGQLRRFFQHCRGIETQLRSNTVRWPQVRPKFEFLAAAAADAYGKQPPKIPSLFHNFIRRNVDSVHSEKDFLQGFIPHFEALVGFGSLYLKERN